MAKKIGRKSAQRSEAEPMVALYGLDEGLPGRCRSLRSARPRIRVPLSRPEHLGNPVRAIAGMPGMRPSRNAFEGQAPHDEFMLVCPMPNAMLQRDARRHARSEREYCPQSAGHCSQSPLAGARAHGRNRQGARRHDPKRSIGYRASSIIVRVATWPISSGEWETNTRPAPFFLAPSHKETPDPRLRDRVEHSRAFIGDKIARSARQRTRDAEALQLSTRKLVGVAATPFGTNAEPRKKLRLAYRPPPPACYPWSDADRPYSRDAGQ